MLTGRTARRGEQGAASIEALGMMLLLTAMLFVIIFVGVAFYNLSVMNTTAQTMSISAQTQMDRWCSPGMTARCAEGEDRARAVGREILAEAEPQLMFVRPGSFTAEPDRGGGADIMTIRRTGQPFWTPVPSNDGGMGGGGWLAPGWGYSFVRLQATFSIWDTTADTLLPGLSGDVPIAAQAITPAYKDPNS